MSPYIISCPERIQICWQALYKAKQTKLVTRLTAQSKTSNFLPSDRPFLGNFPDLNAAPYISRCGNYLVGQKRSQRAEWQRERGSGQWCSRCSCDWRSLSVGALPAVPHPHRVFQLLLGWQWEVAKNMLVNCKNAYNFDTWRVLSYIAILFRCDKFRA